MGQYKASLRPGLCDRCPGNLTTLTVGAVSADQCGCKPPYSQVDDQSYQCHSKSQKVPIKGADLGLIGNDT